MQIVTAEELAASPARRVIVVGSGYAGMTAAVSLAHKAKPADGLEIVLVAPHPYQQALSELDLVTAGTPRPQWAELWHGDIFRGLDIKVVYDRLDRVDTAANRIILGPSDAPTGEIAYWRLILATGAIPFIPPVPGLRERAIPLWSVGDALAVQRGIEQLFEQAAMLTDARLTSETMSVCVVGGGATGVEIMGTIADVWPRIADRLGYGHVTPTLTLLEGRPDILYDLRDHERRKAIKRLEDMGVTLVLGEMLTNVAEAHVTTAAGREIPARLVVWCGGAKADPDAVNWGLEVDNSGRLCVDDHFRIAEATGVYAVGDVAAFRDPKSNRILPMLAQFAIRGAAYCASAIIAEARDRDVAAFEPHMHGEFVSVGPRWGVGWMFSVPVSGWFAIVMKRLTYVMYWMQVGSFRLAWRRTLQMMRMHRY